MPARLSKKQYNSVLLISKKTHKVLQCRGVTRSDFKFFKNSFYLLEINTQPGMTSLSLVPEIANYAGIKFENLVKFLLHTFLKNCKYQKSRLYQYKISNNLIYENRPSKINLLSCISAFVKFAF